MRRYDATFKTEAVSLAVEVGSTKAAKELGIPLTTLVTWNTKAKKSANTNSIG